MTPERVTPELAREMLDQVKDGCPLPWEIFTTETIEGDPREVKNVRSNDPRYDGHLAYSADYEGTTEIDPDAIELIAAAPALAKLVASLRYEYAVQVEMSDGEWHFTDDEFYPFGTPEPRHAEWQTKTGAEDLYASFVEDDGPKHIRIVRRLVSESEVVE